MTSRVLVLLSCLCSFTAGISFSFALHLARNPWPIMIGLMLFSLTIFFFGIAVDKELRQIREGRDSL